jgi:hypothetical protein
MRLLLLLLPMMLHAQTPREHARRRGYPPSDVPQDPEKYSQARARDDVRDVPKLANLSDERQLVSLLA